MSDHNSIYITSSDYDESGMAVNTTDEYIKISNDVTLDINHHYGHTIDVSTLTTSSTTFDITDLLAEDLTISLNDPVEFEDHMPSVAKVEDMCNDYPALAKAYENFKTIYAMVHQDWKGRQDDEPPF